MFLLLISLTTQQFFRPRQPWLTVKNCYEAQLILGDQLKSSKIYNNRINKFLSNNANIIVGIDIQGECDSISILYNEVDLMNGVGRNANDVYVAMRLWRDVENLQMDDIEFHRNNHFIQEILKMHVPRKLQSCPVSGKSSEWNVGHAPGACPFGFKSNLKIVT